MISFKETWKDQKSSLLENLNTHITFISFLPQIDNKTKECEDFSNIKQHVLKINSDKEVLIYSSTEDKAINSIFFDKVYFSKEDHKNQPIWQILTFDPLQRIMNKNFLLDVELKNILNENQEGKNLHDKICILKKNTMIKLFFNSQQILFWLVLKREILLVFADLKKKKSKKLGSICLKKYLVKPGDEIFEMLNISESFHLISSATKKLIFVKTNYSDIFTFLLSFKNDVFSDDLVLPILTVDIIGSIYLEDLLFCPKIHILNDMIIYQNCEFILKFFKIQNIFKVFKQKKFTKMLYSYKAQNSKSVKFQNQEIYPDYIFQCHSFLQDIVLVKTPQNSKKMNLRKFIREINGKGNLKNFENLIIKRNRFIVFDDVYLYKLDLDCKLLQTRKFEYFNARFVQNLNPYDSCGKIYIQNLQDNFIYIYSVSDLICLLRIQIESNLEHLFFGNIQNSKGALICLNDQNWLSINIVSAIKKENILSISDSESKQTNAFVESLKKTPAICISNKENILMDSNNDSKYTTEFLNKKIKECKQIKISKNKYFNTQRSKKIIINQKFGSFFKVDTEIQKGSMGIMILQVTLNCLDNEILSNNNEDFTIFFNYDTFQNSIKFETHPFTIGKKSFCEEKKTLKDGLNTYTSILSKNVLTGKSIQYIYFKINNFFKLDFDLFLDLKFESRSYRNTYHISLPASMFLFHVKLNSHSMEFLNTSKLTKILINGNLDFDYLEKIFTLNPKNYIGQIKKEKQYIFLQNPKTKKISPVIYFNQEKNIMVDMDDPEIVNLFLFFLRNKLSLEAKINQKYLFQEVLKICIKTNEIEEKIEEEVSTLQKAHKDIENLNFMFNQHVKNFKNSQKLQDIQYLILRYLDFLFEVINNLDDLVKKKQRFLSLLNFYLQEVFFWTQNQSKYKQFFREILKFEIPSCTNEIICNNIPLSKILNQKLSIFSSMGNFNQIKSVGFDKEQIKNLKSFNKKENVKLETIKESLKFLFKI